MRKTRNLNGYTNIFDHGRLTGTGPDIVRCRPTSGRKPETAMVACKPEVVITQKRYEISARCQRILDIFDQAQHGGAISNIARCRPTSGRQPEIAMAACKPEVVITQERSEISARFQRILYIIDHAKHAGATSDIVR